MRLGILGGTFDPPHSGHVKAAQLAQERAQLTEVLWVVAREPWQKAGAVVASPEDRLALVEAWVGVHPGHRASRVEIDREGPTYTVDTLRLLTDQNPGCALFLIVGRDVADSLGSWHDPEGVRRLAELVVIEREPAEVSSTEVRRRLTAGESVDGLVPAEIIREIERRGLYPPRR